MPEHTGAVLSYQSWIISPNAAPLDGAPSPFNFSTDTNTVRALVFAGDGREPAQGRCVGP